MNFRAVLSIVLVLATAVLAEPRLAHIFQDNMVLQREMPVPVWGWAEPGTAIEVRFAGQVKQATADEQGRWQITLEPLSASRDGQDLVVRLGDATQTRRNVLVGEVWMAAGQSNMVHAGPNDDTGVYPHHVSPGTEGGKPEIRTVEFGSGASLEPLEDVDPAVRGSKPWQALKEHPLPAVMGPANYFARVVRDGLDVPVGIIRVAVPGTNQGAWLSRETLEGFPGGKGSYYEELLAAHTDKLARSTGPIKSWEAMKKAEADWRKKPQGRSPASALAYANFPTTLYNTRIHPLAPLAFRGAIWHQGEAGPGGPYGERLAAMVRQWRTLFGHDFYFVWGTLGRSTAHPPPLAPVRAGFYRSNNNGGIRKALEAFGDDSRVALVEFYDIGNEETHFLQKAEAGRRLGVAALTVAYGQPHIYSGPRMVETRIEGGRATVRFELVGEGLDYQPSINGISGFYLRGKSGPAQWAEVKLIDKATLELSHPAIAELETVAYAAHPNPHETLFNSAGLPGTPFVVNPVNERDDPAPHELLAMTGKPEGVTMQIAHVRRGGYVFQLKPSDPRAKPPASVRLQAYIPAEWKEHVVESAGKPIPTSEEMKGDARLVSFEAPVDGAWIIVAEKTQAAGLRRVNRY